MMDLHADAIVIDALDVSLMNREHFLQMRAGGITAANYTVTLADGFTFHETVELLNEFETRFVDCGDLIRPVRSVADIRAAKAEGRVGIIYGFQNATNIGGDLGLLRAFHALGVRIIQLTYMTANLLGDGCLEARNAGLTAFGRAAVREMNRLGILIDLSHVGERATLEAIEESEKPVAVTHACPRAQCDSPRNKTDASMRALAQRGGFMGIARVPSFICEDPREANIARYLDRIEYAIDLMGIDHVGIGTDFTTFRTPETIKPGTANRRWGGVFPPGADWNVAMLAPSSREHGRELVRVTVTPGLEDSSKLPAVTDGLDDRGYSADDIRKVLGLNFLRVIDEAWATGREAAGDS